MPDRDALPGQQALLVLTCRDCGALDPGGRTRCAGCGGELVNRPVSGRGTLLTWTLVRRPPAGFDGSGPFAVALIQLEEGVRITAQLADHDPEPALGCAVTVDGNGGSVPIAAVAGATAS